MDARIGYRIRFQLVEELLLASLLVVLILCITQPAYAADGVLDCDGEAVVSLPQQSDDSSFEAEASS